MDKPYKAEKFDATELTEVIANACNCAYADGYNQALEDFVENISLPMTEEQIWEIVEKLKR